MSPILLLILPLPAFIHCNILVEINVKTDSNATVAASGFISDVISEQERSTFGITDELLKIGAEKLSGGRPEDVFLHSPTPWNDLYKTYGWREVTRILEANKTTVKEFTSEPVTLATKDFVNNSTVPWSTNAGITQEVTNTVISIWNTEHQLNVDNSISYKVKMGSEILAFTSSWGNDVNETKTLIFGSKAGVDVVLEPRQAVVSTMTATKVSMIVEIDYTAKLNGFVACNYPKRFKEHHFWAYNVNDVMEAVGLSTEFKAKEIVTIMFYTNARFVMIVKDMETRKVLHDGPAEIINTHL